MDDSYHQFRLTFLTIFPKTKHFQKRDKVVQQGLRCHHIFMVKKKVIKYLQPINTFRQLLFHKISLNYDTLYVKISWGTDLAGVAQLVGHHPVYRGVAGSIPGSVQEVADRMLCSHRDSSHSLPFCLLLSLNTNLKS